ncbi:mechanosensitive ion channel family protein [Zunongwangia sp. HRR-M8]|uniref:mechanosensitive ion channel family protein n=1 Tax=Zunongwangia sp. HRR-M8 TaxID=3015170 RepID=UPI0022DDC6BF|nr:mechanosensitive ion channel family protein [Zunongwangia sp. HRR-M8]WBL22902.1 mechanosensitive ion channel family protein [Zunongwangia sp. HRR-M8]
MVEFWSANSELIIYVLVVIGAVLLLLASTKLLYKWLIKKTLKKYPNEKPTTIKLVKRVLNTLWVILGVAALSFVFISEDKYAVAAKNFEKIVYVGFVLVFTIIGSSVVDTLFGRVIKKTIASDGDPTSYKFLRYLSVFGVYFFGAILATLAFPALRGVAQTALGGAGILALVLGVASQEALANIIGGIFIISFKPFRVGDVIKISDTLVGSVTDITLRHTVIQNYQNKMIVIPNAIINKEKVTNYDLEEKKICQWIEIGISYDSDIDLAKSIMKEECENHPNIFDNRTNQDIGNGVPLVIVRVIDLGDSSVTIRAWAWAWDYASAFVMKCELYESIKKRFDAEGVEIPFPHRTLVFKDKQMETFKNSYSAKE